MAIDIAIDNNFCGLRGLFVLRLGATRWRDGLDRTSRTKSGKAVDNNNNQKDTVLFGLKL